jgi:hypothetical protein
MNDEERYAGFLEDGTLDDALDENSTRELEALRLLLANADTWDQPPPNLADGIVAQIQAAAAAAATETAPAAETPAVTAARGKRSRRQAWPRAALMATAAAAVVAVLAIGALLVTRDDGATGEQFALAATDVVPGASGSATVEATDTGLSISLVVDGLPPAEPGTFYQAWMRGDAGSIPIGTFHAREGDGPIELWSGVDVADYPTMTVTIQQEGAGPESSGVVVLRGEIPEP